MAKKSPRSEDFLAGNAPLQRKDMSKKEWSDAVGLISDVSKNTRENFAETIAHGDRPNASGPIKQKAKKALEALPDAVNKPYSHDAAVENRIKYITKAATVHRLPGEDIGGAGFYFGGRKLIDPVIHDTTVPLQQALDTSSKLSVRTKPELEHESFKALIDANQRGSVKFSPELVSGLNQLKSASGKPAIKEGVPANHEGTIPFSQVHPKVAAELTNPEIRDLSKQHVSNVDLDSLAKTGIRSNIGFAQAVLQGKKSNPYINPKQVSYAAAHFVSNPDTPEEEEYRVRTQHMGKVLRKEVGTGQQMFDFTGLQDSNEGVLSNRATTPADLHERRVSYAQPGKAFTAAPESNTLKKKTATTPKGKFLSVGDGEKSVTPIGIEHAVHQDAVHQTADELQRRLGLPFTVPATLVQETNWAGQRRDEGDDSQYNAVRADISEQLRQHSNDTKFTLRQQQSDQKSLDKSMGTLAKGKIPKPVRSKVTGEDMLF